MIRHGLGFILLGFLTALVGCAPAGYTKDSHTGTILDRKRRIFIDNQTGPHAFRPGFRYPRADSRMSDGDEVKLYAGSHKTWFSLKDAPLTHTRGKVTLVGGRYEHHCTLKSSKIVCDSAGQVPVHVELRDAGWGGKVGIIANGKICSDQHHGLVCTKNPPSGNIGGWEALDIVDAGDGWVAFKGSRDGKYCADDPDGIRCDRNHLNRWEMFRIHPDEPSTAKLMQSTNEHDATEFIVGRPKLMSDEITLRCKVNDLYLSVDAKSKKVNCDSKEPYKFNYHRLDGQKWWKVDRGSIQDPVSGKYLKAEDPKWGGIVKAEGTDKGGWQLFNVQLTGGYEDVYPLIRGVNLGGWFLLEKWMAKALFVGDDGNEFSDTCDAQDEYGLMSKLDHSTKQKRMEEHWSTWITEDDIRWIAEHGLNAVRVPFGYWMTHAEPPFIAGQMKYMEKLFQWCEDHKIGILLDYHGHKGSQNGKQTSGNCGGCGKSSCGASWIKWLDHEDTNLAVIDKMVSTFSKKKAYWGFGIANEVASKSGGHKTMAFYQKAYDTIRKHTPDTYIFMDSTFNPEKYPFQTESHVGQDDHMYYNVKFSKASGDNMDNLMKAVNRQLNIETWQLLVGEWALDHHGHSLGHVSDAEREKWTKDFARAQLQAFEQHSMGWFYWSYKVDYHASTWNYKHMCEKGWVPGCVDGFDFKPDDWFEHHPCSYNYYDSSHMGADCKGRDIFI